MNVKNERRDSKSKPIIILDSSVIIDLVSRKKEYTQACQKLMHDITYGNVDIAILPLVYWEVGNWAIRHHPKMATELISSILLWDTIEHPLDIYVIGKAVDIAARYKGTTFYDASFHALAIILGGTFLTNDKAYYKATHTLGHVRLLRDY